MAQGAWGPLRSTIQPLTAVAWSSFLTGCSPGQHGLYDFIHRVPGRYDVRLTSRAGRPVPDLWSLLSQAQKRVAAINVPMMVPVSPVNGVLVGGIDAPGLGPETVYPPEFIPEIKQHVPHYRIAASERSPAQWAQALHEMVTGRADLLTHLLARETWDCLMVVFSATDIAQHIFWRHMANGEQPYADTILHIYQACDRVLGHLWEQLTPDDTLLLLSDHGAGPCAGALYLNRYLEQGGFLQRREATGRSAHTLLQLGKRFLPAGSRAWLKRRFGPVRDRLESHLFHQAYDWSRTRLYSLGSYGHLYFNLRDREPEGIVDPAGVTALVQEVRNYLDDLRDPHTGEKLIRHLWRREELYHGPAVDRAPDLIIEWANLAYEVRARFGADGEAVFAATMPLNDLAPETQLTGTHRMDGIIAATGRGVQPGSITGAEIIDLAPSLLHLLGRPVPRHMDGRVLPALTDQCGPVTYTADGGETESPVNGLSAGNEAIIAERLRNMGYLG
jgi:predicted AlkP superfamily phosphohydrolase/phosphomutase